jgi:predicted negative regulator of RcsB-dependent stress response
MVYGASFDQLTVEWEHYLRRVEVPDEWKNHVQYFFNRPSIFAKECARAIARMNDAGWKSIGQNLPEKAMGQFSLSLQKSWNTEAFNGLVRSAYMAGKYDTIITLMAQRKQDSSSVSNLLLYYGDALWHNNDTVAARSVYRQIANLDLSDRYDEIVAVRLLVFDDPTLRTALPAYIMGKLNDSSAAALFTQLKEKSANPVLHYLIAKFLIKQKQYQAAIDELQGIKAGMKNPLLDGSKERWMAECYFQMHKFQQARVHQWQSLNYITNEASVNRIEENVDRCEWYTQNMK